MSRVKLLCELNKPVEQIVKILELLPGAYADLVIRDENEFSLSYKNQSYVISFVVHGEDYHFVVPPQFLKDLDNEFTEGFKRYLVQMCSKLYCRQLNKKLGLSNR